ncbi:hypothetical protein B0T24DRAFT_602851 [Lasiosphaeria ovina]|uniref:LSM domain-containing protein n=1 Tax=Lasiosphaeria ovina TaxID=92902 RepID=A0AAE0NJX9_9PEZI|nr:hypothetical protein B0T24DRAFT_602851 [Lasiosphaeria ovina]
MMRDDTSIDISTSLEAADEQAKTREEAGDFLRSLLNKNLRVTTTDSRMFMGSFKCTDTVCSPLSLSLSLRGFF